MASFSSVCSVPSVAEETMKTTTALFLLFCLAVGSVAQSPTERQQFVRVDAPVVALAHVRVIDGTGAAAVDDQTVTLTSGSTVIKVGTITALEDGNNVRIRFGGSVN